MRYDLELSGLNLWLLAGGGALILLLLMLRFALRPRKKVVQPGLGLEPAPPPNELWSNPGGPWSPTPSLERGETPVVGPATPAAGAAAVSPDRPLASYVDERDGGAGPGPRAWSPSATTSEEPPVTTYSLPETAPASEMAPTSRPVSQGDSNGCPKCGGRFLHGEMEGPMLMVDGVAREDFQPLLSARECSACGYLELYTRAARS